MLDRFGKAIVSGKIESSSDLEVCRKDEGYRPGGKAKKQPANGSIVGTTRWRFELVMSVVAGKETTRKYLSPDEPSQVREAVSGG